MTSTDRLVTGVIGALFAPTARLYEMNAAFGVVIVCVAFATTMEVMMATTVANRMTPGREVFWIRILIAFILFGFLLFGFSYVWFSTVAIVWPQCCRGKLFSLFPLGWEGRAVSAPDLSTFRSRARKKAK
jgi:hypothetical protein